MPNLGDWPPSPPATHAQPATQETAKNWLLVEPVAFPAMTNDQAVPFQTNASLLYGPPFPGVVYADPTAEQESTVMQSTA